MDGPPIIERVDGTVGDVGTKLGGLRLWAKSPLRFGIAEIGAEVIPEDSRTNHAADISLVYLR